MDKKEALFVVLVVVAIGFSIFEWSQQQPTATASYGMRLLLPTQMLVDGRVYEKGNVLTMVENKADLTYAYTIYRFLPVKDGTSSDFSAYLTGGTVNDFRIEVAQDTVEPVYAWVPKLDCVTKEIVEKNGTRKEQSCVDNGYDEKTGEKTVRSWVPLKEFKAGQAYFVRVSATYPAKLGLRAIDNVPVVYDVEFKEYAWWNSSWSRYRLGSVSTASGYTDLNYQFAANVSYDSDMNANFSDLRFTLNDNATLLNFWIQNKSNSNWALVWINSSTVNITTANATFGMWYGNPLATTSTSNISTTFIYGNDGTDNVSWSHTWPGGADSLTVINGWLNISLSNNWGGYSIVLPKNYTTGSFELQYDWILKKLPSSSAPAMGTLGDYTLGANAYTAIDNLCFSQASLKYSAWDGSTIFWGVLDANQSNHIKATYAPARFSGTDGVNTTVTHSNGTQYSYLEHGVRGPMNDIGRIAIAGYTGDALIANVFFRNTVSPEPLVYFGAEQNAPDANAPNYSNVSQNTSASAYPAVVNLSALWADDVGLGKYSLSTNESGAWANYSNVSFSGVSNWSNVTWSNSSVLPNTTVGWQIWAWDNSSNVNVTPIMGFLVNDTIAPTYALQTENVSSPAWPAVVKLSVFWYDNFRLDFAVLSTNESGSWANYTAQAMIGAANWSNFTWSNASVLSGTVVGWRQYANDTNGNWNSTTILSFVVTDGTPPYYSQLNQSTANQSSGAAVNLSAKWFDGEGLSCWLLSTNESGSWQNSSSAVFSPANGSWSNYSWANASIVNQAVGWQFWANDTGGNWNVTALMAFWVNDTIFVPANGSTPGITIVVNVPTPIPTPTPVSTGWDDYRIW